MILDRLAESAMQRRQEVTPLVSRVSRRPGNWLHMAVIGDTMGLIVRRCLGDYKGQGKFAAANLASDANNIMSSSAYREARFFLANRQAYQAKFMEVRRGIDPAVQPLCQMRLGAIHSYFVNGSKRSMSFLRKPDPELA
jgi:hypothetical protein